MNVMKCRFLNLMQYMVFLFSAVYMIELAHYYPKLEQESFQFDTVLTVFVCKVTQIQGIEPLRFSSHPFQMSLISYYNIDINMTKPNHYPYSLSEALSLPHLMSHIILMGARAKLANNLSKGSLSLWHTSLVGPEVFHTS